VILVLGGTTEAKQVARLFEEQAIPYLITTTTGLGQQELNREGIYKVLVTRLDKNSFNGLLQEYPIRLIIDATHPFAEQISQLAIQIASEKQIKYLRFQRQDLDLTMVSNALLCSNWEEAIREASKFHQILLTIGVKKLAYWLQHPLLQNHKIYARILPTIESLDTALKSGLTPQHVLAIYGPVPAEIDLSIIRSLSIDVMVTKESGFNGGLDRKIQATRQAGIPIIIVKRPELQNVQVITELKELHAYL